MEKLKLTINSEPKPTIALLGWATIARKQIYQISGLIDNGYNVKILTNDMFNDSVGLVSAISNPPEIIVANDSLLIRLAQTIKILNKLNIGSICIIAPAGRFSIFYLILSKILGHKTICVEWGDIGDIERLNIIVRANIRIIYKFADAIWYKEPYMKPLLEQRSVKHIFFLPNSVVCNDTPLNSIGERSIDFIWANRLTHRRYPEWFSSSFSACKESNSNIVGVMLGFLDKERCDKFTFDKQRKIEHDVRTRLKMVKFCDPYPYFQRARFFVLAADNIFGNNSLLESMSRGVVPIVTDSVGIELIINDGINGIIAEPSEIGLLNAMSRALGLNELQWQMMSDEAVKTIQSHFNTDAWVSGMLGIIDFVNNRR